ncbi:hypothetical protein LTR36_008943 [Oleoguttula mirabilis]|uniref:Uncharacterized protein n=1 Tax=Oleoguttula mirabilis TaxID=1507867 RepID=A0AAV9J6X2_9PEZI|nr:hypothetical protein LTR36_008943 [Oleoguttula mirabilis]
MAADPSVTSQEQDVDSPPGSPSRRTRSPSPFDNYDPEVRNKSGSEADADGTDTDLWMEDKVEPDSLSDGVRADAEVALGYQGQFERPALKNIEHGRIPSIVHDERARARTLRDEDKDQDEDEEEAELNAGGATQSTANNYQPTPLNGTGRRVRKRKSKKAAMNQFYEAADAAGRNAPVHNSEFYDVTKHGPIDDSVTNISSMPILALLTTLNDASKSVEERNQATDRMLRNVLSMQRNGEFARKYLATNDLQALLNGRNIPTAPVIAAMGVEVQDLNQPPNFEQMKRKPTAEHDCNSCMTRDAFERDRDFKNLVDQNEKKMQVLRYGYQLAVNQAAAGGQMPTVYMSKADGKNKTVYQPPAVPGIDVILQAHLPRTQPLVPSLHTLGLATGQAGSRGPAPATNGPCSALASATNQPSGSTSAPAAVLPAPNIIKVPQKLFNGGSSLHGMPIPSPVSGPANHNVYNFNDSPQYGATPNFGQPSTFGKSPSSNFSSPFSSKPSALGTSTGVGLSPFAKHPHTDTVAHSDTHSNAATSPPPTSNSATKPDDHAKSNPSKCAPGTAVTVADPQMPSAMDPRAPVTLFGNIGLNSVAGIGQEAAKDGGKRVTKDKKLDVLNDATHARKKQRLDGPDLT